MLTHPPWVHLRVGRLYAHLSAWTREVLFEGCRKSKPRCWKDDIMHEKCVELVGVLNGANVSISYPMTSESTAGKGTVS